MKRIKKLKGAIIFLLIIGAVAAGVRYYFQATQEPPLKFITTPARQGNLRSVILATGKVQPVSLISVGTQTSGTLKELYVDYNSVVKKGQLIALIDPATQEAELEQALASLRSLQADLAEARVNQRLAAQNAKRSRELYERDLIARSALEADESSLMAADARIESAKARIAQQEASIKRSKLQLGYTRIYSPVDGVVVTKNVDVGQTVAASFNTPTIASIAEDLSVMQVEVNIDEADIGSVFQGQKVEFNVDAYPERLFEGSITQVRLSPTSENNVISYKAIVSFFNEQVQGKNLIPGMTANVTLIVEEKTGVLLVPNAALRFRPVGADSASMGMQPGGPGMRRGQENSEETPVVRKPSVYRLEGDKPVMVQVERGITDGTNTEIISGLERDVEVIIGVDVPSDI
ncbi:MAG: efflux RND transporter periplasmic adaptor subunit [Synergistaceae bacterium]|nr:efflux RND transporter periplasmic adaptor subunit [Synergistaceae bacterium]